VYKLKGRYSGDKVIPDCSVSTGKRPSTILEIGVSQPLQDLVERARMWLIGRQIQLVILVDIQIDILKPDMPSFSSAHEDGSLDSGLPYGLTIEDLSKGDFETVGEKILDWYKAKNVSTSPSTPLIELLGIGIYLYRQDPVNKTLIKQANKETIIFDSKAGFTDLQVTMTSQDLDIPSTTLSKEFQLPLDVLRKDFHSILKEHSTSVAEERATQILEMYGFGDKKDPNYHHSPDHAVNSTIPPLQPPSKPATRSSSRTKHRTENLDEHLISRKKRKRGQEQVENSDRSFSLDQGNASFTTTSTGLFEFESDNGTPDLSTSNPSSFSKAARIAMQQQKILDPYSSMSAEPTSREETSRREARKGKAKAV
jgi:hypothetical protein